MNSEHLCTIRGSLVLFVPWGTIIPGLYSFSYNGVELPRPVACELNCYNVMCTPSCGSTVQCRQHDLCPALFSHAMDKQHRSNFIKIILLYDLYNTDFGGGNTNWVSSFTC